MKVVRMNFKDALKMGRNLTEAHYKEVPFATGSIPLELDEQLYLSMEEQGYLLTYVALADNTPVGYMLVIAFQMPHHKGHWAGQTDSFYVSPEWRKHGILQALVSKAVEDCKAFGLSSFQFVTNENFPAAEQVAESIGAKPLEKTFVIELEK